MNKQRPWSQIRAFLSMDDFVLIFHTRLWRQDTSRERQQEPFSLEPSEYPGVCSMLACRSQRLRL